MEGNLKEIETFLEGNFAEKKEIGRKSYFPKVEALEIWSVCRYVLGIKSCFEIRDGSKPQMKPRLCLFINSQI